MIKGEIDRKQLEASLRKYAKLFGETTAQAVMRWGIQCARDLAFETQAYGTKQTRLIQENAIWKDALNVFLVVDKLTMTTKSSKVTAGGKSYYVQQKNICNSESDFNWWIEVNRTRRNRRTVKLQPMERKVVSRGNFEAWLKPRLQRAGMAKGAWIGAGRDLAAKQQGMDKASIGKNFLSYAQKHVRLGRATTPRPGGNPFTQMSNMAPHSRTEHVLRRSRIINAQKQALRKVVKFYKKALAALDKKKA